jgi:hypothetical protein
MGRTETADAAAVSAEAAVPSEGLRAGRSRGRTKQEYTAARGRYDHATIRVRADGPTRQSDARDSKLRRYLPTDLHGTGRELP